MTRRFLIVILLFVAGCLRAGVVQGWGVEAHHVIGRIALNRMTPAVTRAVRELLGPDDFVAASTWADEVRPQRPETYNWHFVDIPYGASSYLAARDCRASSSGDCIIAALERERRDITNVSLPRDERREALKFLIHFVGDLHQPLHAIDNHDRGGNDVHVALLGQPARIGTALNLHGAWDASLVGSNGMSEAEYAASLISDLEVKPVAPGPIDFAAWAEEAHRVAVHVAYAYPGFSASGPPPRVVLLSPSYQNAARAAIDRQLELAGVRLAAILNATFGG